MRAKLSRALIATLLAAEAAVLAAPAGATSLSGTYLAARSAAARNDHEAAAKYFAAALARDPSDPELRDRTMSFKLLTGDLRGAAAIARLIVAGDPEGRQLAELALAADDFAAGDFDGAAEALSARDSGVNPVVSALLRGWAEVGRGDADAVKAAFEGLDRDPMGQVLGAYHLGLALAAMDDLEGARDALQRAGGAAAGQRVSLALAGVLERLGDADAARAIYDDLIASGRGQRAAQEAILRLQTGEPAPLLVETAPEGAAEALFSIATLLGGDRSPAAALLYARIGLALRPDLHDARLLVGGLLEDQEQHEAAAAAFQRVPRSSPLFVTAEIGRADALMSLDQTDEAVVALESLAAAHPEALDAQIGLATALRRVERWDEAVTAYDHVLSLIGPVEQRHWSVIYNRGIAHERAGQWDAAEADFFQALELSPDNPLVLNYLGYSWVELRRNFDEAQAMIEKAVEQRPDDGYITDSLGWVLYRVGKYDEAVPHLERAVELEPTDPTINDHLGDALWMVGRKREARFQWRRAMSFDPEEKDADRIRAKLDRGLDAVMAQEDAAEDTPRTADAEPKASDGG